MKDNWDDEDVETPEDKSKSEGGTEGTSTKAKGPKPKTAKEKREEKKRLEEEERARIAALNQPRTAEELLADRKERERLQRESDLAAAIESLGGRTTSPSASVNFSEVQLSSREDFDVFTKSLVAKMAPEQKSPYYVPFLENLFRDLCVTLEADDIKRLSASLNALFNEKVKAQKVRPTTGYLILIIRLKS